MENWNWIHPAQIRDKFKCQYCEHDGLASPENWRYTTVDHFIPKTQGGTNDLDNLKTSCSYCNSLKGDKLFSSVEEVRDYIKKRKVEDAELVVKLRKTFEK